MLTRHETRVLYLLQRHGGRAKHSVLSQAMHRVTAEERRQALAHCEDFGLISSAKVPPQKASKGGRGGGPGGIEYWLTDVGKAFIAEAIERGDMKDPAKEPRAGKGGSNAAA